MGSGPIPGHATRSCSLCTGMALEGEGDRLLLDTGPGYLETLTIVSAGCKLTQ